MFANIGVDVDNASIKFFVWIGRFPDKFDHCFDFVYFLMDTVFMPALGIEEYFFFDVVAVDEHVFVLVCFGEEDGDAVFECEIELQVGPQVYHLSNSVDDDERFRLHFCMVDGVPS